jgi:hypothetical protein
MRAWRGCGRPTLIFSSEASEISREQLRELADNQWNVARELHVTLHAVK